MDKNTALVYSLLIVCVTYLLIKYFAHSQIMAQLEGNTVIKDEDEEYEPCECPACVGIKEELGGDIGEETKERLQKDIGNIPPNPITR